MGSTTSSTSEQVTQRPRHDRYSTIIWIDSEVHSKTSDVNNTVLKLKQIVPDVQLVDKPTECIQRLTRAYPSRCYVISSGSFGKDLVPQIHDMNNLESIFIFCNNKSYHETWTSPWRKIKGVHTTIEPICNELKMVIRQVKQDEMIVSILSTVDGDSETDLKRLEPSFMYSSMLKDIFLKMKFDRKHINKMIDSFMKKYEDQEEQLEIIRDFDRDYQLEKAIWWYTRECFVYNEVNLSLRQLDVDVFIDMGFFIRDLHRKLEKLHKKQSKLFGDKPFVLYRGQGMLVEDFNKLKGSKNGLLGFNSFLSTSTERNVSVGFATRGATRMGHVGVLFVMTIDPKLHVVPYGDISEKSFFVGEKEILFSMHSIFKIVDIQLTADSSTIYEVSLSLTNDDDPRLKELKTFMTGEYGSISEHRLGRTLIDMGCYEKAEEIYLCLLNETKHDREKGPLYHCLGFIKDKQGKYLESIGFYRKGLDIFKKVLPEGHPEVGKTYHQIGVIFMKLGGYEQALINYEKSLEVYKKKLPEDHPVIATTYNNIGSVYYEMRDYPKAFTNYEKSLRIKKKVLPKDHPDIAATYNNIGSVYSNMGDYEMALSNYEKSLEIKHRTLPKDHPDIATSYTCLGVIFYHTKKYTEALEYLEKARRIRQTALPPTHPDNKLTNDWIEKVMKAM